jgi:hypothetical protein
MFRAGAAHRPFVGTRGIPRKQRLLTQPAAARKPRPLTLSKLGVRDRTRAVLKASELQLV